MKLSNKHFPFFKKNNPHFSHRYVSFFKKKQLTHKKGRNLRIKLPTSKERLHFQM